MSPIVSLEGKVGLITGIANEKSISTGVAEACAQAVGVHDDVLAVAGLEVVTVIAGSTT